MYFHTGNLSTTPEELFSHRTRRADRIDRFRPPFCDMPRALGEAVRGYEAMLPGGFEYDGRVIVPLDEEAVCAAGRELVAPIRPPLVHTDLHAVIVRRRQLQGGGKGVDPRGRVAIPGDPLT